MPRDTPKLPPSYGTKRSRKIRLVAINQLDGRTTAARRVRELTAALISDLGGADHISTGQSQLVQRADVLGAVIEDFETRWGAGETVDMAAYLSTINAQRRVLVTLGLERKARDLTA